MTTLEKIREKVAQNNSLCPNCGHTLTIETTEFFKTELCENCFDHAKITSLDACCKSPSLHHVKLITSAGTIQVRNQCKSCGKVSSESIGGIDKVTRETLPVLNESLREKYNENNCLVVRNFYSNISAKKHEIYSNEFESNKREWFNEYSKYLQSPEWKKKRELVLKRDNYKCQACLTGLATQVHHKSYEFVDLSGSEPCFDLVSVCYPCHCKIEEMKKNNRKN
jgi:5-methylcytosine-specific restriction endonuclease McrA